MAGMGGVIGTVLGWLGYSVGLRDDAASASGSVHGKLKELRDFVNKPIMINGSAVQSFQRGIVNLNLNGETTTVTISTVNTSKALLLFSLSINARGYLGSSTDDLIAAGHIRGQITSPTTIEFFRNQYHTDYRYPDQISWQVVEFY